MKTNGHTFPISYEIIYIPSFEEKNKEILDNKHIHPFRKHFNVAQRIRKHENMLKWRVETEQNLCCLHGIDINDSLLMEEITNQLKQTKFQRSYARKTINPDYYARCVIPASPMKTLEEIKKVSTYINIFVVKHDNGR